MTLPAAHCGERQSEGFPDPLESFASVQCRRQGLVFLSDMNQSDTAILLATRKSYGETFVVQN